MYASWDSVDGIRTPLCSGARWVAGVGTGRPMRVGNSAGRDIKREMGEGDTRSAGVSGGGVGDAGGGGGGVITRGIGSESEIHSGRLWDHSISACLGGYSVLMSELAPNAVEVFSLSFLNVQYELQFLQATQTVFPCVPDHLDSLLHL